MALDARLAELGRELADREAADREGLRAAQEFSVQLHARVATALGSFHAAVEADAPHLRMTLSEPRVDDKHLHSVQFDLVRGRHRAIVTTKSRGEVTLVGPFHEGKAERPCRRLTMEWDDELAIALEEFLVGFIEGAATP